MADCNDIDWSGEGLPPVGTVCEYTRELSAAESQRDRTWYWCKVVAHELGGAVIRTKAGHYHNRSVPEFSFRPIKTERERAIDEMHEAYFEGARGHMGGIAGIYEAGFRKVQP